MGYFSEFESTASVYNPVDDNNADQVTYPVSADFTASLHIIRLGNTEISILGDEIADYACNPTGDVTSSYKKNAKIVQGSKTYLVVNEPEYRPNTNVTSLELKRIVHPQ